MSTVSNNPFGAGNVSLNHLGGGSPTTWFCGNTILSSLMNNKMINAQASKKEGSAIPSSFRPTAQFNTVPATSERSFYAMTNSSFGITSPQYTQLHLAACSGNLGTACSLLETLDVSEVNKQDHNGNTALIWAVSEGCEEIVQSLVDTRADVNTQNFAGETALIIAASRGFEAICGILLEHGADPNMSNLDGATALHLASAAGFTNTVQLLVSYGAHVNAQDDCGDSPLHYAVREEQPKIVELLVRECNAYVDIKNEDHETPIQLASCFEYTVLVELLSKYSSSLCDESMAIDEGKHEGNMVVFSWARQL